MQARELRSLSLFTTTRTKGSRGPRKAETEALRAKRRRFEDWQCDHCGIDLRENIRHRPRCVHWFDIDDISEEVKSEAKTETKTQKTDPPSTTGGCSGKADLTDDAFQ